MPPPDPLTIARQCVPGSGEPRLSALGSGLNNDTYRVERDERTFSMRIAVAMSAGSILDRIFELEVLRQAADGGLAPTLVSADAERGFLVQDWVAGRSWSAKAVREPARIARMAKLLQRVHALPKPAAQRTMLPSAWVGYYAQALQQKNVGLGAELAKAADARLASLEALPAALAVVCHSDLHLPNLIERPVRAVEPSSLMLLDWEYAHVSEAFWDLAGWSANNDFQDLELRSLLCAYLGREPQETEWTRGKLLVWLYDYVCLLWSQLYLNSRRDGAAAGIAARAGVLQERLCR
jgi:thiamine kinase-like enzyme